MTTMRNPYISFPSIEHQRELVSPSPSHDEKEGYKSSKLAGQLHASIVVLKPRRNFYDSSMTEYSDS